MAGTQLRRALIFLILAILLFFIAAADVTTLAGFSIGSYLVHRRREQRAPRLLIKKQWADQIGNHADGHSGRRAPF